MRGALAGAVGAGVWAAAEPLVARRLGTGYTDLRLLGALITPGRAWPLAGLVLHLGNGAAFGAAFQALGGRGWRQGVLSAEAENLLLWPILPLVSRQHPDWKPRRWPSRAGSYRLFAQEALMHALFGAVLGRLLEERQPLPAPKGTAGWNGTPRRSSRAAMQRFPDVSEHTGRMSHNREGRLRAIGAGGRTS